MRGVMNGQRESRPPEESRPPVLGREVAFFYEPPRPSYSPEPCSLAPRSSMESKGRCDDKTQPETDRDSSPPCKWAADLQYLLDDVQGTELFQKFLVQEGQDTRCLDFLFACRGVKKTFPTDRERLLKLVHVLYEKKVKRISAISEETKLEIKRKITSQVDIDVNIFDEAQHQVEENIRNTTYPNFFKSDLYIQYFQGDSLPVRGCSPEQPECLPTLHEESELQLTDRQQHLMSRKESLHRKLQRNANPSKSRPETGHLKSPYSTNYGTYHARYGSFLPTSAQDSELQSLSSDAQTDDTMSQTDSSVDYAMHRSKQKRLLKNKNMYLNKDCLNHANFIPRTQRLQETDKCKSSHDFHDQVTKKLMKIVEEQKVKEKVSEKLKNIEASDYPRPEVCGTQKPNKPSGPVFDSSIFFGQVEDNDQDILDRHVSRVFEDLGQTPVLSPVCASPPVARPAAHPSAPPSALMNQDLSYTSSQKIGLVSPFTVLSNSKHKREHDTRSNDSGAVTEWISEDNLASRSQDNCSLFPKKTPAIIRLPRDQCRKSGRKSCSVNDSGSSCVDSGISEVCEPVLPSHSKVAHWLEAKLCSSESEKDWKNSPTSPVLSRSSSSQKATYRSAESASDVVSSFARTALMPAQPVAQDLCMPLLPVPDTTTNLIEARRRLEDDGRKLPKSRHVSGVARMRQSFRVSDTLEDGISHRKQSKKALESLGGASSGDTTVIGYSYGQGAVPYLTRYHGRNITLKNFKSLLTKKGNFKYYFKKVENAFGTGTVLEEVCEDHAILPLWEGKVFCVIETIDDATPILEDGRYLQ